MSLDLPRGEHRAGRREQEEGVLELYHNINSVCAQKVRIALKEKGQEAEDHILTLRGDQNEPEYLKLNPNGVVPTLMHDGRPIVESSLILYYIDDVFPAPPLMPTGSIPNSCWMPSPGTGNCSRGWPTR
jgi:hypothetical protein